MATNLTGDALKGAVLAHGGDPAVIGNEDAQRAFIDAKLQAIAAARPVNQISLNWNRGKMLAIFNFVSAAVVAVGAVVGGLGITVGIALVVFVIEAIVLIVRHKPHDKPTWSAFFSAMKSELIALAITLAVALGLAEMIVLIVPIVVWINDGVREWKNS